MATLTSQAVGLDSPVVPNYQSCSAADKFLAKAGQRFMLHYKNGATAAGTVFLNEQRAATPRGAVPAAASGATKWSDVRIAASVGANSELVEWIDDAGPFIDAAGFVNLQHGGTVTTLTLLILGPF